MLAVCVKKCKKTRAPLAAAAGVGRGMRAVRGAPSGAAPRRAPLASRIACCRASAAAASATAAAAAAASRARRAASAAPRSGALLRCAAGSDTAETVAPAPAPRQKKQQPRQQTASSAAAAAAPAPPPPAALWAPRAARSHPAAFDPDPLFAALPQLNDAALRQRLGLTGDSGARSGAGIVRGAAGAAAKPFRARARLGADVAAVAAAFSDEHPYSRCAALRLARKMKNPAWR
jgi:hypothetical protein